MGYSDDQPKKRPGRPPGVRLTRTERYVLRLAMSLRNERIEDYAKRFPVTRQTMSKALNGRVIDLSLCLRLRDAFREEVQSNPELLSQAERYAEKERERDSKREALEQAAESIQVLTNFSLDRCRVIAEYVYKNPNKLLSFIV